MNENLSVPERDINIVTSEIKSLQTRARNVAVGCAIEIGRRLVEAKSLINHGEWGNWLEREFEYSQSTANQLMKMFENYGSMQINIFGEANSQAIENLGYTKALQLIAIPESERDDFIKEHDVENLSTRELDKLIKERDEALRKAEAADELREKLDKLKDKLYEAEGQSQSAEKEMSALRSKIKELESRPVEVAVQDPDEATLAKIHEEAEAENKKKLEKLTKELEAEKKKAENAEKAKDKLKQEQAALEAKLKAEQEATAKKIAEAAGGKDKELEALTAKNAELIKQLSVADPNTAQFKILFEEAQSILNKLVGMVKKADTEKKEGLKKALGAFFSTYDDMVKSA